jgi:exodeoxyribonuclease VII small subunit
MKFDIALKRLEKINSKLEAGDLEIEEALKLYKEGVKLHRLCKKKLKEAEVVFKEIKEE